MIKALSGCTFPLMTAFQMEMPSRAAALTGNTVIKPSNSDRQSRESKYVSNFKNKVRTSTRFDQPPTLQLAKFTVLSFRNNLSPPKPNASISSSFQPDTVTFRLQNYFLNFSFPHFGVKLSNFEFQSTEVPEWRSTSSWKIDKYRKSSLVVKNILKKNLNSRESSYQWNSKVWGLQKIWFLRQQRVT